MPNFIIKNTGFKKDTLSIVAMGAQANGDFINTIAINNAIQKMHLFSTNNLLYKVYQIFWHPDYNDKESINEFLKLV